MARWAAADGIGERGAGARAAVGGAGPRTVDACVGVLHERMRKRQRPPSVESSKYNEGDPLMSFKNRTRVAVAALAGSLAFAAPAWADKVRLATSMGDIVIELDAQKAPKSVANFEQYVKSGFYDGTVFHRVIDNFMIQG